MNPGDLVKLRIENISGPSTLLFGCPGLPWEVAPFGTTYLVEFSKEEVGVILDIETNHVSGITYTKVFCPTGVGWIMDLVLREVE